jgi:hypothetical protein
VKYEMTWRNELTETGKLEFEFTAEIDGNKFRTTSRHDAARIIRHVADLAEASAGLDEYRLC